MGEIGCVGWSFQSQGQLTFDKTRYAEDVLMEAAVEAGADDFRATDTAYEVLTPPDKLEAVRVALAEKNFVSIAGELIRNPKTTVPLEGKNAEHMVKLLEEMEDHDDVQHVFANFDISDKLLESLAN